VAVPLRRTRNIMYEERIPEEYALQAVPKLTQSLANSERVLYMFSVHYAQIICLFFQPGFRANLSDHAACILTTWHNPLVALTVFDLL
jgi:hypothetical protein